RIGVRAAGARARAAPGNPEQQRARSRLWRAGPFRQRRGKPAQRDEQLLRVRRQQLFAAVRGRGMNRMQAIAARQRDPRARGPDLVAGIAGIGCGADGLPSWEAARRCAGDGTLPDDAPRRPSPRLLPANERRRAPESVAVALEVALAACEAAARDPATLPSVFASPHGDLGITHYICDTLPTDAPA